MILFLHLSEVCLNMNVLCLVPSCHGALFPPKLLYSRKRVSKGVCKCHTSMLVVKFLLVSVKEEKLEIINCFERNERTFMQLA
jgi:hypothetical protein